VVVCTCTYYNDGYDCDSLNKHQFLLSSELCTRLRQSIPYFICRALWLVCKPVTGRDISIATMQMVFAASKCFLIIMTSFVILPSFKFREYWNKCTKQACYIMTYVYVLMISQELLFSVLFRLMHYLPSYFVICHLFIFYL